MRRRALAAPWQRAVLATVAALLLVVPVGSAAGPYPDRIAGESIYDEAQLFDDGTAQAAAASIGIIERWTGGEVVVWTRTRPTPDATNAERRAEALIDAWKLGGGTRGVVILFDTREDGTGTVAAIAAGSAYTSRYLPDAERQRILEETIDPQLERRDHDSAVLLGLAEVASTALTAPSRPSPGPGESPDAQPPTLAPGATPVPGGTPGPLAGAPPAGPPYPQPVNDRVVYDHARILSPATVTSATSTIVAIEQRTGAELVIYTQLKPQSDTVEETESDARALMDQWGVGRRGFDDGLVILVNMNRARCQPGVAGNGQLQMFAGPGYRANYLTDAERQQIFEEDMAPRLRQCDFDAALLAGLRKIDAATTPEHAQALERARQLDAAVGLLGAPTLFLVLSGWALFSWLRYGRDPEYLDDPSILMPAPPPDLTPATGALVHDGKNSRRTLTTAMLDLASRGEVAFRDESGILSKKVGLQLAPMQAEHPPEVIRMRRRELGSAEKHALYSLQRIGDGLEGRYIEPASLLKFGRDVSGFNDRLENHAVDKGWLREPPSRAMGRWAGRGSLEVILGLVVGGIGISLPSGGLVFIGAALIAAGIVTVIIARFMPARTMAGAMIRAMLAAYRRTLQYTMQQARSMQDVVASKAVPWLETPDQAMVWGVALGLQDEVDQVLQRSMEDLREGGERTSSAWLPTWYQSSDGHAFAGGGRSSGSFGLAPGVFASSVVPDVGGMMSALGSIGDSPSSSGSGGSGGFSGGSSGGGGGGGSGGGF